MRRAVCLLGVVLAVGAVVPATSSAAVPKRDCGTRAEGERPTRRLASPGDVQIGPVAFYGLARLADADEFERFRSSGGRYLVKAPLKVRAGRVVTVSVTTPAAGLTFAPRSPLATGVPAVRFIACEKNEPAFSYEGGVGPVTAFAGGFSLAEPGCVTIRVRVRGRRTAYNRPVPFGVYGCGRI